MKNVPIRPYLTTLKLVPENQETPVEFVDPRDPGADLFYRRNHFPYPTLTEKAFSLAVCGEVQRPMVFNLAQLKAMPVRRLVVPLECAGDKRAFFRPKVYGGQWEKGGISQGEWEGVPLRDLLQRTGLRSLAREVVFEGYDHGLRKDLDTVVLFARSLPLAKALEPDTIVAFRLNGDDIPFKHGYPLRLIVPRWYAMASVKWLRRVYVIDHPFRGPFQSIDYVYYPHKESDAGKEPVTLIKVNSTIQQPQDYAKLSTGTHEIIGFAMTGAGRITGVAVSTDGGRNWHDASLEQNPEDPYGLVRWSYIWEVQDKGEYLIMSRARDSEGRIQPLTARWNRKGYGYNAVDRVHVKVE